MQRYHIPPSLARTLAQKNSQMLRNALRLWFYCKTHDHQSSFYIKELRPELLRFFHYRQIKKYLSILVAEGWMGMDNRGKYFLRGSQVMFKGLPPAKRRIVHVVLPQHTEDQASWMAFLAASQVVSTMVSIDKKTDPLQIKQASTPLLEGDAEGPGCEEAPVSLENLTTTLSVSTATASRIRRRAANKGLITNRHAFVQIKHVKASSHSELMAIRGELAEALPPVWRQERMMYDRLMDDRVKEVINPNALVLKHGIVYMQRPNMISNVGIVTRKIRRTK